MDETRVNWWMDHTSRWHRGFPPAGWWQAEDGRWHPPGHDDDPTEEVREVPSAGGAHLADGWGWPRWARIAVLASVALVAIVVVAAAAITDGGGDGDGETVTADVSTTVAPSTTAPAPTPPGSVSSVGSSPAGGDTDPGHAHDGSRPHDHDRHNAGAPWACTDQPPSFGPWRASGRALFARGRHGGHLRRCADDLHHAEVSRRAVRQRALAAHRLLTAARVSAPARRGS